MQATKKITNGDFVKILSGKYKGEIATVIEIYDGGSKSVIETTFGEIVKLPTKGIKLV